MFKDYGFDDKDFQDEEGKILSFDRFYEDKNGKTNVDIAIVEQFLANLGVEEYISEEEGEEEEKLMLSQATMKLKATIKQNIVSMALNRLAKVT